MQQATGQEQKLVLHLKVKGMRKKAVGHSWAPIGHARLYAEKSSVDYLCMGQQADYSEWNMYTNLNHTYNWE